MEKNEEFEKAKAEYYETLKPRFLYIDRQIALEGFEAGWHAAEEKYKVSSYQEDESREITKQKHIYTRCYSYEEAIALGKFIVGEMGYEGVQNDSWRYCDSTIRIYFNDNSRHNLNFVYIGVNGYQLVVGKSKRSMRDNYSTKYIEKERVFRQMLKLNN